MASAIETVDAMSGAAVASGQGVDSYEVAAASGSEGTAMMIPPPTAAAIHWHEADHPPWATLAGVPIVAAVVYVAIRQRFRRLSRAPP